MACDFLSSFGWAKLYLHKTADSAVGILETELLPKAGNIVIQRLLQDNGKEFTTHFSGANHKFKQACDRNNIRKSFTRTKHPWTNAYTERLNQTILGQFYSVALRKKDIRLCRTATERSGRIHVSIQLSQKPSRP